MKMRNDTYHDYEDAGEDYDLISEAVDDRPDDDSKELDFHTPTELGIDREEPDSFSIINIDED